MLVLPVLPGGLPAEHQDEGGVVVLQGTDLLLGTDLGLGLVPVTGPHPRQLLPRPRLGSSTTRLAESMLRMSSEFI